MLVYLEFCVARAAVIAVAVLYGKHGEGDPYWCEFCSWIGFLDSFYLFAIGRIIAVNWKFARLACTGEMENTSSD
jgi:hypothetical protein